MNISYSALDEPARPVYRATPIIVAPAEPKEEPESVRKKPRLEYLPMPTLPNIGRPTPTYKATVITKKDDANSYVPEDNEANSSSVTYTPSIIVKADDTKNDPVTAAQETNHVNGIKDEVKAEKRREDSDTKSKEKHSSSSSSKHRSSSSKHKSSSSSHHKKSHRDSKSSSPSHKHKSSSHKSSSSKSSSSSKHRDKSDSKEKSHKRKDEEKPKGPSMSLKETELTSSDDDDMDQIELQCRQIFEDYKVDEPKPTTSQPKPMQRNDSNDEPQVVDKKRQAHENATNVSRSLPMLKPNHSASAMLSAQKRKDMALHAATVQQKARDEQIAKIEASIKEQEAEVEPTPLVNPLILLRPPRRTIAPITHRMAIEAAKRKVAQLNASKEAQFQRSTIAQTAAKTSGRVAHTPTSMLTDIDPMKLAPPVKSQHETKISSNIRTQNYRIMVQHCLKIYPLHADAFERAVSEEYSVYQKCKMIHSYKTSAMLAINRLKKESEAQSPTRQLKTISHDVMLAGKIGQRSSWSINNKVKIADSESSLLTIDNCSSSQAYNLFHECILNEAQLKDNGFPRSGPSRGIAQLFTPKKAKPQNGKDGDQYCARCHKVFNVDIYDEEHADMCNFHLKRSGFRRGFSDNLYYCCQQPSGTDGCCFADYHVTDYIDHDMLLGYVATMDRDEDYVCTKKDVFALDCEMCYTVVGLELTRITVVDFDEKTVFDSFVKPQNRVIDYNTRFSGISEAMLNKPNVKSLPEVQAVLLSMFHSETILVGHSLESDLKALKLIHNVVVDTSVLYPHKMGPPKKKALKTLCIDNLKKIIQEEGKSL